MKFLPFILKNIRRHKLRSLFTVLSIAVSLFLVTLLYAYLDFQDELGGKSKAYNRVIVMSSQGLTDLLPLTVVDKIRVLPHVTAAIPSCWFGGLYQDEKVAFSQFATDPKGFPRVYTELKLTPNELEAWQNDRTGCVVGWKIAGKHSWKVGDRIRLKGTIYPVDLELTVRGIYQGTEGDVDPDILWFHWTYLDELLKANRSRAAGKIGIVVVKAESAAAVRDLPQPVERMFISSDSPVRAMDEETFVHMFTEMVGNVQAFIRNTALAAVFSLICVAANSMAMSLRERTREVAVLRAIGFQRRTVLGMVLGEAVAVALAGGLIGVASVKLLFMAVDPGILGVPMLNMFYVPWGTAAFGLGLAGVVGLVSGFVPACRAAWMPIVDGLRKVV